MSRAIPRRIIDHDQKLREELLDYRGPSEHRLKHAGEHFDVGGQDRGVRIIHMLDSPLDCLYAALKDDAHTENRLDKLRVEWRALKKYYGLFVQSGMIGSIGSVDPNRAYSPSNWGRTHCAGTEAQQDARDEYRVGVIHMNNSDWGHKQTIIVDNFVCHEVAGDKGDYKISLRVSGYCAGIDSLADAELILRDAGWRLAKEWGMRK